MEWQQIESNWAMIKGKAKESWGKLRHYDLVIIDGKRDKLMNLIREKYGFSQEEAEQQITSWQKKLDPRSALFAF